jgi:hypothetical protein
MLSLLLALACTEASETEWVAFNGAADSVVLEVGAPEELDPVSVALTSTTGAVEVGLGTVSPGGGPIGTVHTFTVQVYESYASSVGRVSVRTDSGDRGEDEYDLSRDSAGEGYWRFELESVGEADERRTDAVTFRLWETLDDTADGG